MYLFSKEYIITKEGASGPIKAQQYPVFKLRDEATTWSLFSLKYKFLLRPVSSFKNVLFI